MQRASRRERRLRGGHRPDTRYDARLGQEHRDRAKELISEGRIVRLDVDQNGRLSIQDGRGRPDRWYPCVRLSAGLAGSDPGSAGLRRDASKWSM